MKKRWVRAWLEALIVKGAWPICGLVTRSFRHHFRCGVRCGWSYCQRVEGIRLASVEAKVGPVRCAEVVPLAASGCRSSRVPAETRAKAREIGKTSLCRFLSSHHSQGGAGVCLRERSIQLERKAWHIRPFQNAEVLRRLVLRSACHWSSPPAAAARPIPKARPALGRGRADRAAGHVASGSAWGERHDGSGEPPSGKLGVRIPERHGSYFTGYEA